MKNAAGLIIMAVGIFILIVAIRGTQTSVFPFLFNLSTATQPPGAIPGQTPARGNPNKPDGTPCPQGQVWSPAFNKCIAAPLIGN